LKRNELDWSRVNKNDKKWFVASFLIFLVLLLVTALSLPVSYLVYGYWTWWVDYTAIPGIPVLLVHLYYRGKVLDQLGVKEEDLHG